MKRILLPAALSIILFTGCKKDGEEQVMPAGIYLKQINYGNHSGQFRSLEYNSAGSLARRTFYLADKITERLDYRYTGSRLTQIDVHSIRSNGDETLYMTNSMLLEYQNDHIIKTATVPSSLVYTYKYDDQARITQISAQGTEKEFQYDSRGNISQMIDRNLYNGFSLTFRYTYDDKINPTYRVDRINDAFGAMDVPGFACPNNVLKSIATNGADTVIVSDFSYTYNSDNRPLTSIEHYKDQSQETTKYLTYKYEFR